MVAKDPILTPHMTIQLSSCDWLSLKILNHILIFLLSFHQGILSSHVTALGVCKFERWQRGWSPRGIIRWPFRYDQVNRGPRRVTQVPLPPLDVTNAVGVVSARRAISSSEPEQLAVGKAGRRIQNVPNNNIK